MEETEIVRTEALHLIKDHISVANICLMTNNILDWPLQSESLSNQWLDDKGCIWFLSFNQNTDSSFLDGNMEVFYSNRSQAKFLSVVGIASAASWEEAESITGFPFKREINVSAPLTPIRLVKFFPQEAYYWDDFSKDMVPLMLFNNIAERTRRRMVA